MRFSYKKLISLTTLSFGILLLLIGSPFVAQAASVSDLTPADDAIAVSIQPSFFRVIFDDTVDRGTGNVTLYKASDDSVVETWDVTGDEASFSPTQFFVVPTADLEPNMEYYILIDASAVDGFAGIADETTWSFTTDAYDTPRGIDSLSPNDNATNVLLVPGSPSISFDGLIYAGTGNITLYKASDDSVVETWDIDGDNVSVESQSVSFSLSNPLELGTSYYILMDATAVVPFNGIADETTWNFSTVPDVTYTFERVSVNDLGEEGNDYSGSTAISADGRFVVFNSVATNFTAGDSNGKFGTYVYDRDTDMIERLSTGTGGEEEDESSLNGGYALGISTDGRYVVFVSEASNLIIGDTNGVSDIFVYDRNTDAIERVSVQSEIDGGEEGDASSGRGALDADGGGVSMSSDGRYIAFDSEATNFVADDTNDLPDIFVYDRDLDTIERVSVGDLGEEGDGKSIKPSLSGDGRYVAFTSQATNLVSGDTNDEKDIFVYDRDMNTIERVSISSDEEEGNGSSYEASISSDGRYVVFSSEASNLTEDVIGSTAIFLRDRTLGITTLINGAYVAAENAAESPRLSADGRYVVYVSDGHIYRYDTQTETEIFITEGGSYNDGTQWDSQHVSVSEDGSIIAFASYNNNLVEDDVGGQQDIFVFDISEDEVAPPVEEDSGGGGSSRKRVFEQQTDSDVIKAILEQLIKVLQQLIAQLIAEQQN